MIVSEWSEIKRQSIERIQEDIRLYSKVTIMYQGKMIKGTVIGIDLNGIKIRENSQNHMYKWKYVLGINKKENDYVRCINR